MTQMLESLLPARCAADVPRDENAEQVTMCDFDDDDDRCHGEADTSDEPPSNTRRTRCTHQ